MGFFKKLLRKKKPPTYEMRISPEHMQKYVSGNVQKALGRLQAENTDLKDRLKYLEQKVGMKRKDEEAMLINKLLERQKQLIKMQKQKGYQIAIKTKKPIQFLSVVKKSYFRNIKGIPYKYLKAFEFQDTERGPVLNFLVGDKKGENVIRIRGVSIALLPYLLHDLPSFVNNLKRGQFVVNLTPDGKFIPPINLGEIQEEIHLKDINPDLYRKMTTDTEKIARESPEAAKIIAGLYSQLNAAINEKEDALEREKEALNKKLEAETSLRLLSKSHERLVALNKAKEEKLDNAYSDISTFKLSEQDMKLNETLAESLTIKLQRKIDELSQMVAEKASTTAIEEARENIKDDIAFALKNLVAAAPVERQTSIKPGEAPKIVRKEETKKKTLLGGGL